MEPMTRAVTLNVKPDLLLDARVGTAEGPVWNRCTNRLVWTDIPGESIHFTDIDTGDDDSVNVGTRVGSIVPRSRGGYAMATCQEFRVTGDDLTAPAATITVTDEPRVKFNDGKCDPNGRFFAGTAGRDGRSGTGALYRLDADLTATEMVPGISASNGMGWSPDAKTFYYTDTSTYRIDAFDFDLDAGSLSGRRPFVQFEGIGRFDTADGMGRPDGLCVDAEGCVWVAMWRGWEVRRYASDGRLLAHLELPVELVASVAFVGKDLDTLCITSATSELMRSELAGQLHAGSIFACSVGVTGLPVADFAG
jgi:sugar lactone lactonase YvrE